MSQPFAAITFTPSVRAAQERDGSRPAFARAYDHAGEPERPQLGAREAEFIAAQRSFYMATVSETGWPYVQHRGGPPGFLQVVDAHTLAFADYAGNRQMVTVGNAAVNDRVALILVDYAHARRLKLLGHVSILETEPDEMNPAAPVAPGARVQRTMRIDVAAFDWNCPQHIPRRFEAADVERALQERDDEIERLRALLKA